MKAIIVGAGGTTRELLRRLGELWEVTVIDTDEENFEAAAGIREFEKMVGDGSSVLVLKRAGLEDADALVAASLDDDLNLEAIRIAQEAGLLRILGVAADPERLPDYRALGINAYAPNRLTARHLEVEMEPRRVASTGFAHGKAEAIEFVVSPDSPVRGKKLRQLHSNTWVIAAVLRGNDLIIPHGSTELLAGDRVTVVGAAADYASIVETFTSGESSFPLMYGRKVAVVLDSEDDLATAVAEATSLVRNSKAEQLMVVHRNLEKERDPGKAEEIAALLAELEDTVEGIEVDLRPTDNGNFGQALIALSAEESIGVIALQAPGGGDLMRRWTATRLINTYGKAHRPLLLCRGRHPYSGILVPARRTVSGETAGRAAIDLAGSSSATLVGVSVVPPTFVATGDSVEDARYAAAWLREEAAVQGVQVRRRVRRGNPVRIIEEMAASTSLLVLTTPDLPLSPWRLGIAGHLLRRVDSSVLLVPPRE